MVSGVGCQAGSHFFTTDTLYETTPKWHGFSIAKLAASMAGPGLNSKQIESASGGSNIDDATLYLI
jgi:hypothetical protein